MFAWSQQRRRESSKNESFYIFYVKFSGQVINSESETVPIDRYFLRRHIVAFLSFLLWKMWGQHYNAKKKIYWHVTELYWKTTEIASSTQKVYKCLKFYNEDSLRLQQVSAIKILNKFLSTCLQLLVHYFCFCLLINLGKTFWMFLGKSMEKKKQSSKTRSVTLVYDLITITH